MQAAAAAAAVGQNSSAYAEAIATAYATGGAQAQVRQTVMVGAAAKKYCLWSYHMGLYCLRCVYKHVQRNQTTPQFVFILNA